MKTGGLNTKGVHISNPIIAPGSGMQQVALGWLRWWSSDENKSIQKK